MNILAVLQENSYSAKLFDEIEDSGHDVHMESSGLVAFTLPNRNDFDAILLDDRLPYLSGIEIAMHLRRRRIENPIILTSTDTGEGHRRIAIESGVDAYLLKPTTATDVVSAVHHVLFGDDREREANLIRFEDLVIDRGRRSVTSGALEIPLTRTQFRLLWLLCSNPNAVLGRDAICSHVWRTHGIGESAKFLTALMVNLRQRLAVFGDRHPIVTVRGSGYMFVD